MSRLAQISPVRLQFGSFEFDPGARELRKHGLKIKVPPQAFCVLSTLLETPGELVTREELIRRLWPNDTHVEFEGNLNAITRVLREALGDSARNPRFIETEPKLGYRFVAPVSSVPHQPAAPEIAEPAPAAAATPPPAPVPQRKPWRRWVLPLAVALAGMAWTGWRWIRPASTPPAPVGRLTQLTHFLGSAGHPTFSPDGERVAFQWNGDGRGDFDIYEMRIGSEEIHRVTTNPADDLEPAWSPDGRDIAFVRSVSPTQSALLLAAAVGGGERQVALLPRVRSLAWSPDGKWIAYSLSSPDNDGNPAPQGGISALSLSTGRTVALTPSDHGSGDAYPAFSPDGRMLAFARQSDVWTLALGAGLEPEARPRRLTRGMAGALNLVWTPDGKSIVFAADRGAHRKLLRAQVAEAAAAPSEVGGEEAFEPAVDATGRRIAYSRSAVVDTLNTLALCGAGCAPAQPQKLLYTTKVARNPSFSPDGSQLAFESSRSGHTEIWLCARDGSNPRQLTNLAGPPAGTPNWSPDGRWLVFDAAMPGGSAILTVSAAGGAPRQLTSGSTKDLVPFWSHDGRRIYFASKRTGTLEIWWMPAGGGDAVQVTRGGGLRAVESADGRFLYYARGATRTSIWKVPVDGGAEAQVVASLSYWQNFSVLPGGIYFVPDSSGRAVPIQFYDFATGAVRPVGSVEALSLQGISASPDNRTLVLSRRESADRDLMLLEFAR